MKKYFGNYLGLCIDNNDPQKRGRVQVFIPHIMPALFENWNEVGEDIQMLCLGDNLPQSLPTPMVEKLKKILPWAEAASPIMGTSAPGGLESNNYTQFPDAVCPPGTTPAPIPQAGGSTTSANNVVPVTGRYIEGNIGPTSTGAHFDIKQVGRGYFDRSALDQYVQVDGKPLSSGKTVPGGRFGASRSYGSHRGWDFAFGGGTNLTLANGARWVGSTSTSNGDKATFELPDGRRFEILHGRFEGSYSGSTTAGSTGSSGNFVCYPTSTSGGLPAINPLNSPNPIDERASIANPTAQNTGGSGGTLSVPGVGQVSGSTQIRNFNGSQPEAFATVRAAAQAAGSPDPNITASIAMFESGHLGSSMAKRANNPFGQTITRGQIGTNGIVGSTTGADGQLHAVYNSLESAVADHIRRWGNRYVPGNVSGTTNNMIAGGYNIETISGLGPGQYWANGVLNRFNALSGQTAQPATGLAGTSPTSSTIGGTGLPQDSGNMVMNTDGSGPAPMININNMAAGMFSYPAAGALLWIFFREGNPLFPVYFAANYGEREWASAYRLPGPGQDGVGYKPAPTSENPITSVGGTWNVGKVGVHQWHYVNDPNNPLNNERSYAIGGFDGSNLAFTEGKTYLTNQFDFRESTNGDKWTYIGGSTEEFYHGATRNINNYGDTVVRYGNTSPEAVAAAERIVGYINQMMAPLAQSTVGAPTRNSPGLGSKTKSGTISGGTETGLATQTRPNTFNNSVAANVVNNTSNSFTPIPVLRGDISAIRAQQSLTLQSASSTTTAGSPRVSINVTDNLPSRSTPMSTTIRTTIPVVK